MTVQIRAGALAPEAYQLVLVSDAVNGVDLSTVADAAMVVQDPTGEVFEWACTRSFSSNVLTLTHVFHATTSELNRLGTWLVYARLITPGGTVRSQPRPIIVRNQFELVQ